MAYIDTAIFNVIQYLENELLGQNGIDDQFVIHGKNVEQKSKFKHRGLVREQEQFVFDACVKLVDFLPLIQRQILLFGINYLDEKIDYVKYEG